MKFWRKYHKWGGILLSLLLIFFAISGIVLNHRPLVSSLDIPRTILSSSYQYNHWNNAALRGSVEMDADHTIFYGNVGCWLFNPTENQWTDFNDGFPKGIDNRKVSKVIITAKNRIFAGTHFGLFEYINSNWEVISLSIQHPRITDLIEVNDTLHILTRSELGLLPLSHPKADITFNYLPTPPNYQNKTGVFKTLWVMHSGEILGTTGKLLVDAGGILMLFFVMTGLIWFINPKLVKRAKQKQKSVRRTKRLFRWSVKWHNTVGIYTFILLTFTTLTGIFLRPPLLITIANSQISSIPNTMLDTPNAWYDQLGAIRYNEHYGIYFVSTSKGFYVLSSDRCEIIKIPVDPPVSVMGINVLEPINEQEYLIGSFSGLYRWNPITSEVRHFFNGKLISKANAPTRPISDIMATGYHQNSKGVCYFDYNKGAVNLSGNPIPQMPKSIINRSPMSLWNIALEVHTGRIFQDAIGPFYILIVPLTGLFTLILLGSGVYIWWKKHRKRT